MLTPVIAATLLTQFRTSTPQPGELAPDFNLKQLGQDKYTKLSDFKNKKPVVLIFGSYT
jgi:peroxiredoxin